MTALPTEVTARALEFNEAQHPRVKTGPQGGQFTSGSGGGQAASGKNVTYTGKLQPIRGIRTKHNYKKPGGGGGGASSTKPATPTATLKRGTDNDPAAVQQLQAMLGELGLGAIAVDGQFGPETENAVKAAQLKLGIKPTGSASSALQRRLRDAHTLSPCIDRARSKVTSAVPVAAAAGRDVTPGHDELHHYWTRGKGLAKWSTWTELVAHLTKYVGPLKAKTFASRWFFERYHFYAGADLNRVKHGKPPRGKLIGPG